MSIYTSTKVVPYVYWLTHKETGQFYIGYREANKIPSNQDLPNYQSSSKKVKKLGFKSFDWKIVAEFFDGDSAYEYENRLIESNIKDPLCMNKSFTKEGKRKFSNIGNSHSAETKAKISAIHKGRIVSDETKAKISLAKQNISDESRAKISKAKKGILHTLEHNKKISQAGLGRKNSPEHIEKTRQGHLGSKRSEETKAKIKEKRSLQVLKRKTWKLQNSNGIIFTQNLKEFCKENKLGLSKLLKTQETKKPVETGFSTGWMIISFERS